MSALPGSHPGPQSVAAVIVNHQGGDTLLDCVASFVAEGVETIVVVDNDSSDGSPDRLEVAHPEVKLIRTGRNLGYGAGANVGWRAVDCPLVVISNPDVVVHQGAVAALRVTVESDTLLGIAGPLILESDGSRYPSARRFPSWTEAAGHAVLGAIAPGNRFSRRYRMGDLDLDKASTVDWVSGAFFMARRSMLDELGGFDERYFMYLEDVDLCWRAHTSGYTIAYAPSACVTHLQGLSTARQPYRMLWEHHRSALRFSAKRATGWRRIALIPVAIVLGLRLLMAGVQTFWRGRSERHGASGRAD